MTVPVGARPPIPVTVLESVYAPGIPVGVLMLVILVAAPRLDTFTVTASDTLGASLTTPFTVPL